MIKNWHRFMPKPGTNEKDIFWYRVIAHTGAKSRVSAPVETTTRYQRAASVPDISSAGAALISPPKGKGERLYSGQAKRGAAEDRRRTAEEEERGRSRGQEEDGGRGVVLFPFPLDLLRLPLWSSPIRFLITIAQSIAGGGAQQVAQCGTITAGRMLLNIHQTQI